MTDTDAAVALGGIFMILGIASIALWQAFKTWQVHITNKAADARDQAYETLADKAVYTQQKLLEQQERLLTEVGEVKSRVLVIEQRLAEVD